MRVERGCIYVDDRRVPLLSGSVHFWRLAPGAWPAVLDAVKDLGLEVIDTYVAWEFHEVTPGEFDFNGASDPRRDLEGFLALAEEKGLYVIIRPGPFIYAEWPNMGLPADVAAYHRAHPHFRERAAIYIAAVSTAIAPHQATWGGCVALLQPDNEVDPFEYCYEEQLGLGEEAGAFHDFLRRRYGNVAALNRRWGTALERFEDARALRSLPNGDRRFLARHHDFIDFRFEYVNEAVAWFAAEYRRNGIDVPLMHNTYDILSVQDARALAGGPVDIVGTDAYPPNDFERFVATGESISHQRFIEFFRYYGTFSDTNFLAEFESGIAHGLHYYSGILMPNHYRLMVLSAILAGVNSWNWYMLVNRDNWMMTPINEWGRRQRELFDVFKELVALYREIDVPSLRRLTATGATFHLPHQVLPAIEQDPVLGALYGAGIDYRFYDVERGSHEPPAVLFYAGDDWLPRECQQRLAAYVEEGGHLVLFPQYPTRDEDLEPWNGLRLVEPDGALNEPFLDHLATEVEVMLGPDAVRTRAPLFTWSHAPGEPITGVRVDADIRDSDFEENRYLRSLIIGRRYTVGYRERRGRGSVTFLGIQPSPAAVIAVHRMLGIALPVVPDGRGAQAAAYEGDGSRYVVLVNAGQERTTVRLELGPGFVPGEARSLRDGVRVEAGASALFVDLPRKDGTVIAFRPGTE